MTAAEICWVLVVWLGLGQGEETGGPGGGGGGYKYSAHCLYCTGTSDHLNVKQQNNIFWPVH